jgi:[CysO sulfur-carrier protein]-S-L-cysteine hydrolase
MTELDGALYKELLDNCLKEFPNEACGIVGGRNGRALKVFAMRNADASHVSYRFDAKEQLAVLGELEREGLDLFGIYHSHTDSEAYPSEVDRRLAFYPDSRYLILSLSDWADPVLRCFRILDGDVEEEELSVD